MDSHWPQIQEQLQEAKKAAEAYEQLNVDIDQAFASIGSRIHALRKEINMSTESRPLNENENTAIKAYRKKGKLDDNHYLVVYGKVAKVSYERMQGGFCICCIIVPINPAIPNGGSLIFRGASRRSYKDPINDIRGEMLAFSRALLYSRPVELS